MQKIITAMGLPELNKKLKIVKEFSVYDMDIQYREGIIDILKKDNDFDILIIFEKLPGEISFENLIKEIKIINDKITIIFILENRNNILEKILLNENIKNIFYNDEINFKEFIFRLKNLKFNKEDFFKQEINNLNQIISKKNNELLKYKKNKKTKREKNITIISNLEENKLKLIKENIFNKLKIKIIYFNFNNLNNKIKYSKKIIFVVTSEFEDIKKLKKYINLIQKKYFINSSKINILFFEKNKNTINFKIIKFIFKEYFILGKINLKNNTVKNNNKIIKKIKNK